MKTFTSSFLSSFLVLLLATITPTYSLITSISAPTTILRPGQNFTVTFHTANYIQNNLQFYALFGIAPSPGLGKSFLGTPVPAVAPNPGADGDIGKDGGIDLFRAGLSRNGLKNFNVTLKLPSTGLVNGTRRQAKNYTLQTGVLGNVGASGLTTLTFYNTTIRIRN